MVTLSLDEKKAGILLNLLKVQVHNIKIQIKQLENEKKELEGLIDNILSSNLSHALSSNTPNHEIVEEKADHTVAESKKKNIATGRPNLFPEDTESSGSSGFIFKEINFNFKNLPEVTFGKNRIRRTEDKKKIYLTRSGYRIYIRSALEDLIYLQEHPSDVSSAIQNLSKNKQITLIRIMKEIDFNKLDVIFESISSTPSELSDVPVISPVLVVPDEKEEIKDNIENKAEANAKAREKEEAKIEGG